MQPLTIKLLVHTDTTLQGERKLGHRLRKGHSKTRFQLWKKVSPTGMLDVNGKELEPTEHLRVYTQLGTGRSQDKGFHRHGGGPAASSHTVDLFSY